MKPPEFAFDHPSGLRICRDLQELEVASLAGVNRRDMGTGYVWYSMPVATSESGDLQVAMCFHLGILDSVSFAVNDTGEDRRGSEWSEETERSQAKRTQKWLKAQGYAAGRYSWGEVWACYDPKSGSGSAGIRYKQDRSLI